MMVGSFVDKCLTEPGRVDAWLAGLDDRERAALYTNAGEERAEMKRGRLLVDRIRQDETAGNLFANGRGQQRLTCQLHGCEWVCILDAIVPECGLFVELKTTGNTKPDWQECNGRNVRRDWFNRYWLDMAIYQIAVDQNFEGDYDGFLVAGILSDPVQVRGISYDPEDCRRYAAGIAGNVRDILDWKSGVEEPPRCRKMDCEYCATFPMEIERAVAWF
uniref:Putative exodeoxyribonuclease 8 PDDEXK-like domain-containing protein n=1 Tax=viral metagenome TaxID=1070528 RepID=A0A6M3LHK4_9ZZZZ